jgi:hypothetical protein
VDPSQRAFVCHHRVWRAYSADGRGRAKVESRFRFIPIIDALVIRASRERHLGKGTGYRDSVRFVAQTRRSTWAATGAKVCACDDEKNREKVDLHRACALTKMHISCRRGAPRLGDPERTRCDAGAQMKGFLPKRARRPAAFALLGRFRRSCTLVAANRNSRPCVAAGSLQVHQYPEASVRHAFHVERHRIVHHRLHAGVLHHLCVHAISMAAGLVYDP